MSGEERGYGLFDDKMEDLKKRVAEVKEKKGRGLLICYQKYNEERRTSKLISAVKSGLTVVLVTDAGTPCISDPGHLLVSQAHLEGLRVTSVPGPSALNLAITLSGFPADKFNFYGYLSKLQNTRLITLQ